MYLHSAPYKRHPRIVATRPALRITSAMYSSFLSRSHRAWLTFATAWHNRVDSSSSVQRKCRVGGRHDMASCKTTAGRGGAASLLRSAHLRSLCRQTRAPHAFRRASRSGAARPRSTLPREVCKARPDRQLRPAVCSTDWAESLVLHGAYYYSRTACPFVSGCEGPSRLRYCVASQVL